MDTPAPIAIITGGTGYLGRAITSLLVSHGWEVAILSRSQERVDGATVYQCDITNEDDIRTAVERIMNGRTSLSACIHAASPALVRKPIAEVTAEERESQMNVAFLAASLLSKYTMPYLKGGAFIGITTQAIEPGANADRMGAYPAAKSALRTFLRSLAHESDLKEIRVYAVAPGFLLGGLNADLPLKVREFLFRKMEGEASTPEAVAELILALLQEPERYPSGNSIAIPSLAISPL